jgi:hypothetical protein
VYHYRSKILDVSRERELILLLLVNTDGGFKPPEAEIRSLMSLSLLPSLAVGQSLGTVAWTRGLCMDG